MIFFTNITKTIDIAPGECILNWTDHLLDPIEIAVEKYKHHPSIRKIKDKVNHGTFFEFQPITMKAVNDELSRLNTKKRLQLKVFLRGYEDIFVPFLTTIFQ